MTENKKTALERLEDIENTLTQLIGVVQPIEQMIRDITNTKEALKLLNNKIDSVVGAAKDGGQITEERVEALMIENNVKDLKAKADQMVTSGVLVASDAVSKEAFVVLSESDPSGKVVNPRMQFLLSTLQNEELRGQIEAAKVGDNIKVGDTGASITVLESYNVATPQAPAAAPSDNLEAASAASTDAAPEAAPAESAPAEAPAPEAQPASASA